MKNVIHIFGASGSGTTTRGRKISGALGYALMDADDYFWLPTDPKFTQKRPREERLEMMMQDLNASENIVISGSLVDWGDALIPYFTLAVRIEIDPDVRIARLQQREKERFGTRIEMGGDMYQQHLEFIEWAKAYDTGGMNMRSKMKHDEWQKLLRCDILHLNGADTVEDNLEKVKRMLQQ